MKNQDSITFFLLFAIMFGLQTLQAQASNVIEEDVPKAAPGIFCTWHAQQLHLTGSNLGELQLLEVFDRQGRLVFRTSHIATSVQLPVLPSGTYQVRFMGVAPLGEQEISIR